MATIATVCEMCEHPFDDHNIEGQCIRCDCLGVLPFDEPDPKPHVDAHFHFKDGCCFIVQSDGDITISTTGHGFQIFCIHGEVMTFEGGI